jgi:hypothetical protein
VARGTALTLAAPAFIALSFAGTAGTFYRGDTASASVPADVNAATLTGATIGALRAGGLGSFLQATFGAAAFFPRALSAAEIQVVRADYTARYGVPA